MPLLKKEKKVCYIGNKPIAIPSLYLAIAFVSVFRWSLQLRKSKASNTKMRLVRMRSIRLKQFAVSGG